MCLKILNLWSPYHESDIVSMVHCSSSTMSELGCGKKLEALSTESFLWCDREHCFATAIQQCCCHKRGSLTQCLDEFLRSKNIHMDANRQGFPEPFFPLAVIGFIFVADRCVLIFSHISPLYLACPSGCQQALWGVSGCPVRWQGVHHQDCSGQPEACSYCGHSLLSHQEAVWT